MRDGRSDSNAAIPQVRRVVVAMSGGVDSSVAAALMKQGGHEVIGVTLRLQNDRDARDSRTRRNDDAIARARAVAEQLGIPHRVLDAEREFEHEVLRPAWEEYASGRTPSPCLLCNERIKFGLLSRWAQEVGADCLATGHYARVGRATGGEYILLRGFDPKKDQSYFLAGLDRDQLAAVVFPLGHLRKAAVRELARSLGLCTAETPDSRSVCLVGPDDSFAEILRERFSAQPQGGVIVDETGAVLGRHSGLHRFTVGQRRGLGVSSTGRLWVKEIRAKEGVVVLTDQKDALLCRRFRATGMKWLLQPPPPGAVLDCAVQVRYRHGPTSASVSCGIDGSVTVVPHEPIRAVTPGQAAVFYDGDRVLGRGWIAV